ncbi:MAG: tetratricopeptide repeat protein [bacterium]|nr:tetratricopeptide repeat protein [bacterium]
MKSRHIWFSIAAVLLFGFLLSRGYGDAEFLMREGNYYFGSGEYDLERAERAFERAVGIEPGILWGHYQLARIYFIKEEFEKALEEINLELEFNPENLRSLYVRGLIYGYGGELEKAEEDFRNFTRWAPKEWAGYNDLAWILAVREKYEEAREVILRSFEEVPGARENPWLFNSLGVAELNLKEHPEAEKSFKKARELSGKLSENDWRLAYPGNNPDSFEFQLKAFQEAIETNLQKARLVDKQL